MVARNPHGERTPISPDFGERELFHRRATHPGRGPLMSGLPRRLPDNLVQGGGELPYTRPDIANRKARDAKLRLAQRALRPEAAKAT